MLTRDLAFNPHREAVSGRAWMARLHTEQRVLRERIRAVLAGEPADARSPIERLMTWRQDADPSGWAGAERVARLAVLIGGRLPMTERDRRLLASAARLHDLGLLTMPAALVGKPAALSADERELVRQHPEVAAQLLEECPSLDGLAPLVLAAWEAYAGGGYPRGLRGTDIPLVSRVIGVAAAYEGMLAARPHRAARSMAAAASELRRGRGTQFDPAVVDACLAILGDEGGNSVKGGTGRMPQKY